nr:hypothetical protein [Prevotella sp. UBA4952]
MEKDIREKVQDILNRNMLAAKGELKVFIEQIKETLKYKEDRRGYIKGLLSEYCKLGTNKDGTMNFSGIAYIKGGYPELSDKELLSNMEQLYMNYANLGKDTPVNAATGESLWFLETYYKYNWLKSHLVELEKPQQMKLSDTPVELQSDEAKRYLDRAKDMGLIDNNNHWKGGLQKLAYFASIMSDTLHLGKGEFDGKQKVNWQPFEKYFGIPKGKLRLNLNDLQKTGISYKPIEKIFE